MTKRSTGLEALKTARHEVETDAPPAELETAAG